MTWDDVFAAYDKAVLSRAELFALGATSSGLTSAVRGGHLVRARRDHYLLSDTSRHIVEAVRIGARLACVSALSHAGIFTLDSSITHVHLVKTMSRSRSPRDRFIPLTRFNRERIRLHWHPLVEEFENEFTVGVVNALAQVLVCQKPVLALASIDNALHLGHVDPHMIPAIFASVPARLRSLESLVDSRAESGQETVLRRIIASTGLDFEAQVWIDGVGRVDFVVAGRLVVEADSREAHDGWELHVRDRGRDLAAAARGFATLRPAYQHTMGNSELVRTAICELVARHTPS